MADGYGKTKKTYLRVALQELQGDGQVDPGSLVGTMGEETASPMSPEWMQPLRQISFILGD
jgi:hypothetical protein